MTVGLINYYVISFRSAPIMPWDIFSLGTALLVTQNLDRLYFHLVNFFLNFPFEFFLGPWISNSQTMCIYFLDIKEFSGIFVLPIYSNAIVDSNVVFMI